MTSSAITEGAFRFPLQSDKSNQKLVDSKIWRMAARWRTAAPKSSRGSLGGATTPCACARARVRARARTQCPCPIRDPLPEVVAVMKCRRSPRVAYG